MSEQYLLLFLGFTAGTIIVFYFLGWILQKRWKYLAYPTVLIGIVGVILILVGFTYRPDCSLRLDNSWCGAESLGSIVYGAAILISSLVFSTLGLVFAHMGSKRQSRMKHSIKQG